MERKQYEAMKKDELIDLLLKQAHLAAAVEAKDKEISALENSKEEEIKRRVDKELGKSNQAYELKVKEISDMKEKHQQEIRNLVTQGEENFKIIESLAKTAQDILDRNHALLKILQGTVDTHVEMHEFSTQIFKSHFPKNIK